MSSFVFKHLFMKLIGFNNYFMEFHLMQLDLYLAKFLGSFLNFNIVSFQKFEFKLFNI